ncbi:hypothetical protein SCLCIDRAFT_31222 [Scleroderma citrinum Foug A]|uniref:Uncharacterized protein n=1 Tax=Scleroderma citrinum Foug A TaxID=1036808 RepID=A0A0C3DDV6_9AGAM|nr:hypothetical protein SCLCIDRAFT_31222 [Scleroderma citrinum Foug A]
MASSGCASRSSTEDPDIQPVQEYSFDSLEPEEPKAVVKTNLREDEVEILEEALEDWKGADKNQRKSMKNVMKARIKNLPANSTLKGHEWDKKKKGIKNWLYNHSCAHAQKALEYVKQFAEEMWQQCGMWVVVMAAWKGQNGQPMMGMHDFNGTLGEGKTFQNWDDIKHHWDAYMQDALQEGDADVEDADAEPMAC